ncbi:hypothetical protein [Porphyromonas macacae]|uniref:hypothetical protein n=1 Tax=Porphyromonas macacae TaxID=28115 RepID=UPI0034E45F41
MVSDKLKLQYRTNEGIRAREVRLVGDNVEQGIYSIQEARRMAQDQDLDLVEISPNANRLYAVLLTIKNLFTSKRNVKKSKELSLRKL